MYTVVALDGQKYGPVDLATLNAWAADGRVVPTTTLESADGQRLQASQVPGIVFGQGSQPQQGGPMQGGPMQGGAAPGYGAPTTLSPGQPGYGSPDMGASGYAPYQNPGVGAYGMDNGQGDVTKAWIFGAVGFFCCAFLSIAGIIYGNKAMQKGHPQGKAAMIFCIVTLVLGIAGNLGLRAALGGFGR